MTGGGGGLWRGVSYSGDSVKLGAIAGYVDQQHKRPIYRWDVSIVMGR